MGYVRTDWAAYWLGLIGTMMGIHSIVWALAFMGLELHYTWCTEKRH